MFEPMGLREVMLSKFIGRLSVQRFIVALAVTSGLSVAAQAQDAAATSCLGASDQASPAEISGFVSDPGKTLAANQDGGIVLSSTIQKLAASNSTTFAPIMDALVNANDNQKAAAAAGLARAVDACRRAGTSEAATYADAMQAAVVGTRNEAVITAFQAALRDLGQAVASIGGGAAGGAAGGGATGSSGSQDGAANSYRPSANNPTQLSSLRTYSINYVNSYGDSSTATSNSGTGQ